MYIWKTEALAEELKQETLSNKDRFLYLLFFVAIQALLVELSVYTGQLLTPSNVVVSTLFVVISVIGTWFCYRTNQAGDGKDFIGRYVCMWLPLALRITVLATAVMIIIIPIGDVLLGPEYLESDTWIDKVILLLFELIFYWRLTVALQSISQNQTPVSPE